MAQTTTTLPRYQPSGFFRPTTFALFLAAIAGGVAVAWIYQLLMRWIPFIYLNALICAGFGFALGAAAAWAIKTGHCRNRIIALVLALPLVMLSLGASYYWDWKHVVSEIAEKDPELAQQVTFSRFIDAKLEAGWEVSSHGGSGSKMNGSLVYIIWSIEGLILLGIGMAMTWGAVNAPYCERCNQWGNERKMLLPGLTRSDADPLIQSGDLDTLIGLQSPPDPNLATALTMTATLCPTCKETGFLTVEEKRVLAAKGKRGKAQEKTVALISHAVLRADQRAKFLDRLEPGAAPAAAAAL